MSGINSFSDYSSKYNSNIDYSALFGTASIHQWEQLIIYQIMLLSEMEAIRN